jgi:hypothetical protein
MSERDTPCLSCPYRKDAPLRLWHRSEFESLLAHDADPIRGAMFHCHGEVKKPTVERAMCVGWLLDQKKRGTPSIRLRLRLMTNEEAREAFDRVASGGAELYPTIKTMCRANGVRKTRRK